MDSYLENERSQALVRCAVATIVLCILGYLAFTDATGRNGGHRAVAVVAVFWALSLLWALWVWLSPQSNLYRRRAGLLFDVAGTTTAFILANHLGAFFYPVYQWIIIGHGVRYGKQAMVSACALAVAGFGLVVFTTPYWRENYLIASGLMVGLIVLPLYLLVLLQKMQQLNERLQRELSKTYHSAIHDPLTGITNRQYFNNQLGEEIARAQDNDHGLAVLFIDLDEFKTINDQLGHTAGDKVLKIVAERLKRHCRDEDITSRYGGDEFALIIKGNKSCAEVEPTVIRLLESIREPISIDDEVHRLSGSIGVSIYPENGQTADALTHNADLAMYQAKHRGKNGYVCFSQIDTWPIANT